MLNKCRHAVGICEKAIENAFSVKIADFDNGRHKKEKLRRSGAYSYIFGLIRIIPLPERRRGKPLHSCRNQCRYRRRSHTCRRLQRSPRPDILLRKRRRRCSRQKSRMPWCYPPSLLFKSYCIISREKCNRIYEKLIQYL